MTRFVITGGKPLRGTVRVPGAKNAALPILAACLMSGEDMVLRNCPRIRDVDNMLAILGGLGVKSEFGEVLALHTGGITSHVMPQGISKELRSSIFMLGPLLARCGKAVCTYPGGCEIGSRPIDLHLKGLSALGVDITEEYGQIVCTGKDMRGADIHLDYPSVGATENIMMAATAARGITWIHNVAREPEIEDLQDFLNGIGCRVEGAGTSDLCITGGRSGGKIREHTVIPDRIVAGTLLAGAAITGGTITLENACPAYMGSVLAKLAETGSQIEVSKDRITIKAPARPSEIKLIETMPYPGFPTDMQAQFFALLTVAEGTSVVVENLFENRFKHGAEMLRMGAKFTLKDRAAVIRGVRQLRGARVHAQDLRGGAALVLAGLCAKGVTVVENAEHVDRGYERLEEMLGSLGAQITREEDEEDTEERE